MGIPPVLRAFGAAVLLVAIAPAWVAARDQTGSVADYCITTLEHDSPDSDEAHIVSDVCFETFADALAHAGRGAEDVHDEESVQAVALTGEVSEPSYPRFGSGDNCVMRLERAQQGSDEARVTKETCFPASCTPNCATMGVMNNATSSLQFKP